MAKVRIVKIPKKYQMGGTSGREVQTKNTIPELPPLSDNFKMSLYNPELQYIRDNDKVKEQAGWRDKARANLQKFTHTDINGQLNNDSNSYLDLIAAPFNAAINLTQPSHYKQYDNPNNPWYDRMINQAVPIMSDVAQVSPFAGPVIAKGLERVIPEVAAIPRVMQQAKNLQRTLSPGEMITPEEANLLKNSRVIGSITHGGGEEGAKLQQILSKVSNTPDDIVKRITGMTKDEIGQKIETIRNSTSAKKVQDTPQTSSSGDYQSGSYRGTSESTPSGLHPDDHGVWQRALENYHRGTHNFPLVDMEDNITQNPIESVGQVRQNRINNLIQSRDSSPENLRSFYQEQIDRYNRPNVSTESRTVTGLQDNIDREANYNTHPDAEYEEIGNDFDSHQRYHDIINGLSNSRFDNINREGLINDPRMQEWIRSGSGDMGSLASQYTKQSTPTIADRLYNKWAQNKQAGFSAPSAMPVTESLIPAIAKNANNNPAAEILRSYGKVKDAPSGRSFIPAHSLSTDSYPMSLKMMQKAQQEGVGDINYHGHTGLNNLGFATKAELPIESILKENNSLIDKINQGRGKKIPYGYINNDGQLQVPQLTVTRKEFGGNINNNTMPRVKVTPPKKQTGGYTYQRLPQPPQGIYGQYTQQQQNDEMYKTYRDVHGMQTGFDAPIQQASGFNMPQASSTPVQQPMQKAQSPSGGSYTGDASPDDYSIDNVRKEEGLAQYGGIQGKRKVRITPPSNDQQIPQAKYGQAIPGTYNQFDDRWNPVTFQGQIGINPKPDPFADTKRTLPEAKDGTGNVNAEKNEMVLGNFTPDGMPSLMDVNGPPHTQGGKDIAVPDGSFIFSDTKALKVKDPDILQIFGQTKPQTPASLAKKYDLQKFTKVISDPHADPIAKKTAEMMVGNYTEKLNQLAAIQEQQKERMGLGDNQQQPPMGMQQTPMAQLGGGDIIPGATNLPFAAANNKFKGYPVDQAQQIIKTYGKGHDTVPYTSDIASGIGYDGRYGQNTAGLQRWEQETDPGYHVSKGAGNPDSKLGIRTLSPNRPYGDIDPWSNPHNTPDMPSAELPSMPETQPTTKVNDGYTPSADKLGSYTQTNVPFTAPTPDKWGIANSILNAATIHRYPAWEAPIGAVAPDTVFEDPTRALAALHEQSNASAQNAAISGNSRAARSNALSYQNADAVANTLGAVNNRNVQTSNQASDRAAQISNILQQEQAQRLNRIYQGNVTSAQQYDNALRESRNDVVKQKQTAWNDRSKTDFLNKTSPYFYFDPVTGARNFKSPEAEAHFNNEINHLGEGSGLSQDSVKKYAEAYKYALANGVTNDEDARKYAREHAGWTDREKDKFNAYGINQGDTTSRSTVENKFGGKVKPKPYKFGGMTNHQLSKFIKIGQ